MRMITLRASLAVTTMLGAACSIGDTFGLTDIEPPGTIPPPYAPTEAAAWVGVYEGTGSVASRLTDETFPDLPVRFEVRQDERFVHTVVRIQLLPPPQPLVWISDAHSPGAAAWISWSLRSEVTSRQWLALRGPGGMPDDAALRAPEGVLGAPEPDWRHVLQLKWQGEELVGLLRVYDAYGAAVASLSLRLTRVE